jgi:hypothetical protein
MHALADDAKKSGRASADTALRLLVGSLVRSSSGALRRRRFSGANEAARTGEDPHDHALGVV